MPVPVVPSDEPDPESDGDGAPDGDRPTLPLRLPPGGTPAPG
jgi:hypothetical protein